MKWRDTAQHEEQLLLPNWGLIFHTNSMFNSIYFTQQQFAKAGVVFIHQIACFIRYHLFLDDVQHQKKKKNPACHITTRLEILSYGGKLTTSHLHWRLLPPRLR